MVELALPPDTLNERVIASVTPDIRLYVGGHGSSFAALTGDRCFSAAHDATTVRMERPHETTAIIDSGAFTDGPADRLTPAQALARQLDWEQRVAWRSCMPQWQAQALVSYDLLIDETWVSNHKRKRRWSVRDAERAVGVTVDSATYLVSQRTALAPRRLILSAQGVDALQYAECMRAILVSATSEDWIGLGGWCILGRFTSWLPTFWATLYEVLPLIAARGIRHVHLFGVLYQPALGGLLWLADRHGLTVSVDSSAPARSGACTTDEARKKAGARAETMEDNVAWWVNCLAMLRQTTYYRQPPHVPAVRQRTLWEVTA